MITAEESPELIDKQIAIDARYLVVYTHNEVRRRFEEYLGGAWHVTSIEERSETLYDAETSADRLSDSPDFELKKALATFDITAIENGPLERIVDGEPVAIPRRKMRCKAELADDGSLKIVECDVDVPRRSGL